MGATKLGFLGFLGLCGRRRHDEAAAPEPGFLGARGRLHRGSRPGRAGWLLLAAGLTASGCVLESKQYIPLPPSVPQLRLPRNDAYHGSVLPSTLRPRFVWEPSTVKKGTISYELQYSADATFEADVTTIQTEEPRYQPDAPLPVATTPPVGRRYYWRVRACLPTSCSEYSPTCCIAANSAFWSESRLV